MKPFSMRKTIENNRKAISECLAEAGIVMMLDDIVFVTDEGNNKVK